MPHPFKLTKRQLIDEINDRLKHIEEGGISLDDPELLIKLYGLEYAPRRIEPSVFDDAILCFAVQCTRYHFVDTLNIVEGVDDGEHTSFARSYLVTLRMFCNERGV